MLLLNGLRSSDSSVLWGYWQMGNDEIAALRKELIEAAGNLSGSFGSGRILGQIYAHMFFSKDPQCLDDLVRELEISKGSASTAVRQLEHWGALRRVWIKGDRKDYYEAEEDFGGFIRRAILDIVGHRMESLETLLAHAERLLSSEAADAEEAFFRNRINKLISFRQRAKWMWNNVVVRLLRK